MLDSYGLAAYVGYSGFFSWGWDSLWRSLQNYVAYNHPVPVMVDLGALRGPSFGVHWAIAYKIDGGRVYLGNMSSTWNSSPTTNEFLGAWHCWFLPYGFNHCGVYV